MTKPVLTALALGLASLTLVQMSVPADARSRHHRGMMRDGSKTGGRMSSPSAAGGNSASPARPGARGSGGGGSGSGNN